MKVNCFTAIKEILLADGIKIPYERVYEFFDSVEDKSFVKHRLSELAVGDLILWRKNTIPFSGDTGHIAIIREILTDGWIRVYDYSKQPHSNEVCTRPGLGEGEMKLILDGDEILGFIWSKEIKKTKMTKVLGISPQDLKVLF
ncbi:MULTISPECIES: hypothetical protein [unclassified Halobacteriovorax]|uniref:hypothetical protein n=1 Tax=unclassified Halobacteriovorax TaxID=2639665 RepID=UPI00399A46A8